MKRQNLELAIFYPSILYSHNWLYTMLMSTLDYARLPGMNSLFLDYLQNKENALQFYPPRDKFREVEPATSSRIVHNLEKQNTALGNPSTNRVIFENFSGTSLTVKPVNKWANPYSSTSHLESTYSS